MTARAASTSVPSRSPTVATAAATAKPRARDLTGSGRVLLVEDEDAVRRFAVAALKSKGYEVLQAADGVEALEVMKAHDNRVDLVVSDVGTNVYALRDGAWHVDHGWQAEIAPDWRGHSRAQLHELLADVRVLRQQEYTRQNTFKLSYYVPLHADQARLDRAIAERLGAQPEILANARRRVEDWLASREGQRFYARKWAEILAGDASSVAAFLVDRGELAVELRQSSPFAGALNPRERWKIWPMTTPSAPDSRGASIRGTQLMPNSAWPPATTVAGTISTAPGRIVTSKPSSL